MRYLVTLLILSHIPAVYSELEAGIGLSAVHFPHYIGSDQTTLWLCPFLIFAIAVKNSISTAI